MSIYFYEVKILREFNKLLCAQFEHFNKTVTEVGQTSCSSIRFLLKNTYITQPIQ